MFSTKFKVTGALPFPVDMLRYDSCYPRTEADSLAITHTFDARSGAVTVEVEKLHSQKWNGHPTIGRWESFSWRVHAVVTEKVPS